MYPFILLNTKIIHIAARPMTNKIGNRTKMSVILSSTSNNVNNNKHIEQQDGKIHHLLTNKKRTRAYIG